MNPLPDETIRFRKLIIDATWDPDRFGYVDRDCYVGSCPVCGERLGVHFARAAARAVLTCYGGCTEDEIAASIRRKVAS